MVGPWGIQLCKAVRGEYELGLGEWLRWLCDAWCKRREKRWLGRAGALNMCARPRRYGPCAFRDRGCWVGLGAGYDCCRSLRHTSVGANNKRQHGLGEELKIIRVEEMRERKGKSTRTGGRRIGRGEAEAVGVFGEARMGRQGEARHRRWGKSEGGWWYGGSEIAVSFGLQASTLDLQGSGSRLQAWEFRLQASGFRLRTAVFALQSSAVSPVRRDPPRLPRPGSRNAPLAAT